MDAPNPSAQPSIAVKAPIHIGAYALAVRDLPRLVDFYRETVGLEVIERDGNGAVLGAGGVPLLHLEQRPDLKPDDKATAGLFHSAFVMPTRADLARWYAHAQRIGLTIPRTGDHLVNEAIYYDDPEGNGCECYSDRPPETWEWDADGQCNVDTGKAVDLADLAGEAKGGAGGAWQAPAGLRVGHMNLRVGDYGAAERFYSGVVGLDFTGRRHVNFQGRIDTTITFMSSGRYHHHFAANDFTSRGTGQRDPDRAGISWFAFEHDASIDTDALKLRLQITGAPVTAIDGGFETRDPWGTRVRFVRA
jgi:catechol 2,3-dioxygenase